MPNVMVIPNVRLVIRLDPLVLNLRTTDWNQVLGFAENGVIAALIAKKDPYLTEALNALQAVRDSLHRLPPGADSDSDREDHMRLILLLEQEIREHLDIHYSEEAAIAQAESVSEGGAL